MLVGLITTEHSLARSDYWPTRKLLAAGFPLWPNPPLIKQPDHLGLPLSGHVDARLSADANSTCFNGNQAFPASNHPKLWPPSSRITEPRHGSSQQSYQFLSQCTSWIAIFFMFNFGCNFASFRYGLVVRIAGSHPAGPGSIPGNGKIHFVEPPSNYINIPDPKKKEIKKIENWIFLSFYFSARVTPSLRGLMDKASVS